MFPGGRGFNVVMGQIQVHLRERISTLEIKSDNKTQPLVEQPQPNFQLAAGHVGSSLQGAPPKQLWHESALASSRTHRGSPQDGEILGPRSLRRAGTTGNSAAC